MKKLIATICLFLGIISTVFSQAALYKQYYSFAREKHNVDSSYYCLKQIFSDPNNVNGVLKAMIYNAFPEAFTDVNLENLKDSTKRNNALKNKVLHKALLVKVTNDSLLQLIEPTQSLLLWSKVQDSEHDKAELINLTNEFIAQNTAQKDFYHGYTGRYGLMIYNIINKHPDLQPLAKKLVTFLKEKIKNNQIAITANSQSEDFKKRSCHRYLYAYINYLEASSTDNLTKKQALLKTAFEYSPDLIDKQYNNYGFDKEYLKGKDSYGSDYLDFLKKNGKDKKAILAILLRTALYNPVYKHEVEKFYQIMDTNQKPFNVFWRESIEKSALVTTSFAIKQTDKKVFSSKEQAGKWVLIDFWGTWCHPCREEHPTLQKFYDTTILKNADKISILTIACMDTEDKVLKYMNEKGLSFPVAMSDENIEKKFAISSFPTKLLMTPKGNYITIPNGVDWVTLIKEYAEL